MFMLVPFLEPYPLFPRVRVMIRGLAFGGRAASQRAGIFVASSEAFMLTSRRTMPISPDSAAHATAPIPDLVDMQASIEGKRKWDTKSSALREGAGAPMKSPYLAARYLGYFISHHSYNMLQQPPLQGMRS